MSSPNPNDWRCVRCLERLEEECVYLPNGTGKVHPSCFRCTNCAKIINRHVVCQGNVYCRKCYRSTFLPVCAQCGYGILQKSSGPATMARGKLYHVSCFACTACSERILGKFFVEKTTGQVYCPNHPPKGATEEQKQECQKDDLDYPSVSTPEETVEEEEGPREEDDEEMA